MIIATSINEVIAHLEIIIERCKEKQSRVGYFACLYRKMTLAVKAGIINGQFQNGPRMEMLDVTFANRYLQAWEAYTNKQPCTNAWCAAFDAAAANNLIVLQHLMLGINTHINLDLAIAAAETAAGGPIQDMEGDFNRINDIIASLTKSVQDDLTSIWPPLTFLTKMANRKQDEVLNFSIGTARKASWINAVALSAISHESDKAVYIRTMDQTVCELAKRIIHPGFGMQLLLQPVLRMEDARVRNIIGMLYD